MALIPWMTVLLLLKGSHSYILLTANLDDVHSIAKQIAHSPVAGQLNFILRRASNIFNQQLHSKKYHGYKHRSSRSNTLLSDLLGTMQDNHIGRRSPTDQAPHDGYHHHHRRSQSDSRPNLLYRRNLGSKNVKETSVDQQATMTQEMDHKVPSKEVSRDNSDGKNNLNENRREDHHLGESSHQKSNAPIHQNEIKNNQEVKQHSQGGKQAKLQAVGREEDSLIKEKEDKSKTDDARKHTEEVVALGKNASFYLNSMKNIMENA